MKKFLSAIAVGVFLTNSITGFAAGIDSIEITDIPNNETTKTVTVTGTVPADKDVSLKVYKKGKTSTNLANEALNAVLYYGSQKKANSQAQENITFDFPMSGEKGAYMVEINYVGSTSSDKLSEIFVYLPETDELAFIGALNGMHKEADEIVTDEELTAFADKIEEYVNNQYLIMPDNYAVLSANGELNAVFKIMMYDEDYTQIEDVPTAFTTAYNVSKIGSAANTEAIDTLLKQDSEFVEQIGLDNTEALDVYLDTNFVFDRSQAAAVLAGDNVVNAQTAKDAFEKKVVTLAVGAQTKYTIMDILKALNSYLSLDFTKYDTLTAKQESFREYLSERMPLAPTIDDIKSYYQDAVTNVLDKVETNQGGSYRPSSDNSSRNDSSSFGGASAVVIPQVTVPESVTRTASFTDLSGYEWAADDIVYLYENNYIDGTSTTTFNPAAMVKREEYLKMLVNAAKITGNQSTTEFTDVINGAWYEKFVALGVENGIVNGQSEDNFGVGMNVTREDMAVMMYRVLKDEISMSAEGAESFKDFDNISEYAKEAVACMQNLGIINGMDDGSFCPKDNATRAQAAVCIRRMLKYIE